MYTYTSYEMSVLLLKSHTVFDRATEWSNKKTRKRKKNNFQVDLFKFIKKDEALSNDQKAFGGVVFPS